MPAPAPRVSREEYFSLDASSETKVEYYDGVTLAMAGASPRHNLVAGNVHEALRRGLRPRACYVAQSDQRTTLATTQAWVYPDVVVSCAPRFEGPRPQSLANPELVVEVLSSSTEQHDLTAKLAHYRATETIQEIVFVHLSERLVEHHRRVQRDQWMVTLVRAGAWELVAGMTIELDEIYLGLDALPPE